MKIMKKFSMNRKLKLLLTFIATICLGLSLGANAARLTIKNNCSYPVNPGIYPATLYSNGGWAMKAGETVSFQINGTGRVWARTECDSSDPRRPAQCRTGQCGGTGLQCAGTTGEPNTSLFEFTLNPNGIGTDWYNISYVDAVNPPIGVSTSNKSCVSPNSCSSQVISQCPAELKQGDNTCLSACTKYDTDQYCCRGAYGTAATCALANWSKPAQTYVNNIHKFCPNSYSYAYDEASGALQTCATGGDYELTYCPSGGGSSSSPPPSSSNTGRTGELARQMLEAVGGKGLNGAHSLTPLHSPGNRLDDLGSKTASGSPVGINPANGGRSQTWVFADKNVRPDGHYNIAVYFGAFCLDVTESGSGSGTNVVLTPCDGRLSQSWKAEALAGSDKYTLKSAINPDKCLGVPNASQQAGIQVAVLANCSAPSQQWKMERVNTNLFKSGSSGGGSGPSGGGGGSSGGGDGSSGGGGGSSSNNDLQFCVDENNRYRQTKGLPALTRSSGVEQYAAASAEYQDRTRTAHSYFGKTGGVPNSMGSGENMLPGWQGWSLNGGKTIRQIMTEGIKMMWDEGPGGGHYENMVSTSFKSVGCGVFVNSQNGVTVSIDFTR